MPHILIVDDEENMQQLIAMYLENAGFTVSFAENEKQVLANLEARRTDLILLDIMLPGKNGLDICGSIREFTDIPIIFLTARGEEWDKVKGLQIGGDDYIVKPFSPGELTARIQAVLRRYRNEPASTSVISTAGIEVEVDSHTVKVKGRKIGLTFKEFELLLLLMKNSGRVFSREQLLGTIWGESYSGGTRTVDTHIKTLRIKLGPESSTMIATVWGIGYKFEETSR